MNEWMYEWMNERFCSQVVALGDELGRKEKDLTVKRDQIQAKDEQIKALKDSLADLETKAAGLEVDPDK